MDIFRNRRFYNGASSHYLCNISIGQTVKLFKTPSAFSFITNFNVPMIMICNGAGKYLFIYFNVKFVGIAPFRGFWHMHIPCKRLLLFGCKSNKDVLYKKELDKIQENYSSMDKNASNNGSINVMIAYSREAVRHL